MISCSTGPKPNWQASMGRFAELLAESIKYTEKQELTSKERVEWIDLTKNFADLSRAVSHSESKPSNDPSFIMTAQALEQDLDDIRSLIQRGNDRAAKKRLSSVTQYCVACHSMREGYEKDPGFDINSSAQKLTHKQRAEFFASTRQFEKAILEFESALSDKEWSQKNPSEWNEAALRIIALIVRTKNDPDLALDILSRFFDVGSYPDSLKTSARTWKAELKKWRNEKRKKETPVTLASVKRLIFEGEKLKSIPQGRLIHDLRASRILHYLKSTTPKSPQRLQELYFYSGEVASRLSAMNYWEFPQEYFARCVRVLPKTETAVQCLLAYKQVWSEDLGVNDVSLWPKRLRLEYESLSSLN